jgi:hypothetical protein
MTKRNEHGGAALWTVLVLLVVGAFGGYQIGRLYFDHEAIQNEAAQIVDVSLLDPKRDPKQEISRMMVGYGVSVAPDSILYELGANRGEARLTYFYTRAADLLVYRWPIRFGVSLTREARKASGVIGHVQDQLNDTSEGSSQKYINAVKNATSGSQ